MNPISTTGAVLLAVGLVGYGVGVTTPYPGRAFSLTAITLGVALVAIGPSLDEGSEEVAA